MRSPLGWAWSLMCPRSEQLWRLLDSRPVVVFVGLNGAGKSLAAVASLLPILKGQQWKCSNVHHNHHRPFRQHAAWCEHCQVTNAVHAGRCDEGAHLLAANSTGVRHVLSTCRLTDRDGFDHPLWVPFTDYRQLLTFEHGEVFMDEVAGISDASGSATMPVQVINHLHKLRHFDVTLRVTTPAFARCSLPIRQTCQVVVHCRSFLAETRSKDRRRWRSRKAFLFSAYDATAFEDFTAGKRDKLKPLARGGLWRPGHPSMYAFDTLDQVLALGHVSDAGMCMVCGGTRARPKCACATDVEAGAQQLEVVEEVSRAGVRTRRAVLADVDGEGEAARTPRSGEHGDPEPACCADIESAPMPSP